MKEKERYFAPETEVLSMGPKEKLCDILITSGLDSLVAPGFEDGGELV